MSLRRRTLFLLLTFVFVSCTDAGPRLPGIRRVDHQRDSLKIHLFGGQADAGLFEAAKLAASGVEVLAKPVDIVDAGPPDAVKLAALADDPDVLGALTIDGAAAIDQSGDALDRWMLPVFELRNDLYEREALRPSVFQMAVPHSWEAYRLARYFGPGDRGYGRIGLIRSSSLDGETAASTFRSAASLRGLELVETSPLSPVDSPSAAELSGVVNQLRDGAVEAVVVEGTSMQLMEVNRHLTTVQEAAYLGRAKIRDGWRPQLAGFDSLFSVSHVSPGTVAAGEYARAVKHVDSIGSVKDFLEAAQGVKSAQTGHESLAFDAVKLLVEGVKRAGANDHEKVVKTLEGLDKVRFARISISFGPTDHVAPERDHLGLWATPAGNSSDPWMLLMRTFTSDLERTNILEEDWPSFFDGTTPGGEAPFFHLAKRGIVTNKDDDLH